MLEKLHFFDGLERQAAALIKDASNTYDNSKRLRNSLQDAESDLRDNFTREEIEDNLDFDLFATTFAEMLWETVHEIEIKCKKISAGLGCRKGALDDVLAGIN